MARVISFHARNSGSPSPDEVVRALTDATFTGSEANPYHAALRRVAQRAVVDALLLLASDQRSTPDARAVAEQHLARLADTLAASQTAAATLAVRDIRNWLERRVPPPPRSSNIPLPPGTPIGN
jgi:hypothetical protein